MQERENSEQEPKTVVAKHEESRIKRWSREVFGQFVTTDFWKNLFATIVREALKSFFITLGGTLIVYGKKDRNQEVVAATGMGTTSSDVANKAFGGGNSFNPGGNGYAHSYPVSSMPSGDTRFPGFGR